ncbi:hypothetical protein CNMCM7691_005730 [Aspergillus felis]|uniref:Uncharacterized protein n=1 Tax=Aspergillus felis TaxID=1287682 RepID=A0A8H6V4D1_9EURO|nr:hypothetical protein CNMCM7691_005730 [Aspergillus felis]
MHFIKCYPQPLQLQTLQQALQNSSRRHRLYIAAGLACGVIQYHGNWLEEYWDTSDIYLPADHDGGDVGTDDIPPSNNLYLPWSLNSQYGRLQVTPPFGGVRAMDYLLTMGPKDIKRRLIFCLLIGLSVRTSHVYGRGDGRARGSGRNVGSRGAPR